MEVFVAIHFKIPINNFIKLYQSSLTTRTFCLSIILSFCHSLYFCLCHFVVLSFWFFVFLSFWNILIYLSSREVVFNAKCGWDWDGTDGFKFKSQVHFINPNSEYQLRTMSPIHWSSRTPKRSDFIICFKFEIEFD